MNLSPAPKNSSLPLGLGIALLVIGQMVYTNGVQQAARDSLFDSSGSTTMTVGGVILLVGVIVLIFGVVNLARAIDYIARREHMREFAESGIGDDED